MFSFNNTTTTRAVFQHNADNFDFQKIESELTSILTKSESGFFPSNLSPTSSQYYDMWSTQGDFFKPQFLCNNSNNSNEFIQKTRTPAPNVSNEQVRAIIKKSNTIIATSETKTEISNLNFRLKF